MKTEELKTIVLQKKKEGKVVIATCEGLMEERLEDIIRQPADGLLYDLNRDELSILATAGDDNPYWVNNFASAQVIRYLKEKVEELEEQLNKEEQLCCH